MISILALVYGREVWIDQFRPYQEYPFSWPQRWNYFPRSGYKSGKTIPAKGLSITWEPGVFLAYWLFV